VLAADAAFGAHHPDRAAELAERAVELAEQQGQPVVLCEALAVVARCASRTDLDAAAAAHGRAAQVAAEHGLLPQRVEACAGSA
jgi:hypothetical protein